MPNNEYPYLKGCKADHRLLGATPLLNPMCDHVSSQRSKMFSDHVPQSQVLAGAELPHVFSGYENQCGDYEIFSSTRDQDMIVKAIIHKFDIECGSRPIRYNPYDIIITMGCDDKKLHYIRRDKVTMCSPDYGYENKFLNTHCVAVNDVIPKDAKLTTSPNHIGAKYGLGTNLNTVYMSVPGVTEDSIIVSESTAEKCTQMSVKPITVTISSDQIPLNIYGDDEVYKAFPDIGEQVREDGCICILRRPTVDSFIADTNPASLSEFQPLHDNPFYVEKGAEVVDIIVHINRNNKCKGFKPEYIYDQFEKYREQMTRHYRRIVDVYENALREGFTIDRMSEPFSHLVTTAMGELLIDGEKIPSIPRYGRGCSVTPIDRKHAIEFIQITFIIKYPRKLINGSKLTGRQGNKGVVSMILPDEYMPVDEQGIRADIIVSEAGVFNRMNPSQWYEQFIGRTAEIVRRKMEEIVKTTNNYQAAWDLLIEFERDITPQFADIIISEHPTQRMRDDFVDECIRDRIYVNVLPFQSNIGPELMLKLRDKYGSNKSRITWKMPVSNGVVKTFRSKVPVMIGSENWMVLAKYPHQHGSGISTVNQYKTPIKCSKMSAAQYPINQTPYRLGEDEIRNITLLAGPEVAAKILGQYANNSEALEAMARYLLTSKNPGELHELPGFNTERFVEGNNILNMLKYKNACFGVEICPEDM